MHKRIDIDKGYMTRRDVIRLLGTTTAAALVGLPYQARASALPKTGEDKPNIIFILTDNIQYDDSGFMNHPFIQTPGLDKLAGEGVVFENAFNTTSLCSPSRASILTGAYAHNHGVRNNHTPWTGQKPTFAFVGKWHMPGEGLPDMPYLDLFVSYTYREGQGSYVDCPLIVNGKETQGRKRYLTEELTDRALEFIEERAGADGSRTPFCLYLSHRAQMVPGRHFACTCLTGRPIRHSFRPRTSGGCMRTKKWSCQGRWTPGFRKQTATCSRV